MLKSNASMKGYVQIYTGNGKGKTTAALGLALRAAGAGMRVFIAQFIKGKSYSEDRALKRYRDKITLRRYGCGCFIRAKPKTSDIEAAERGLFESSAAIQSGKYGLVILDEAAIAAHLKLLAVPAVLKLIQRKPSKVEIVITGRNAPKRLIREADLVTEMREKKHYYRRGVKARKGIEK